MWCRHLILLGQMSAAARTSRHVFHNYDQPQQHSCDQPQQHNYNRPQHQPPLLSLLPSQFSTSSFSGYDLEDEHAAPLTDRHGGSGIEDYCMKKAVSEFFLDLNLLPPFPKTKDDPCLQQVHLLLREQSVLALERTMHLSELDKAKYADLKRMAFAEMKASSAAEANDDNEKMKREAERVKAELEALAQDIIRGKEATEAAAAVEAAAKLKAAELAAELQVQAAKAKAAKLKAKRQRQKTSKKLQKEAHQQKEKEEAADPKQQLEEDKEKMANSILEGVQLCQLSLENGFNDCCEVMFSDQVQEEGGIEDEGQWNVSTKYYEYDDNDAGDCEFFVYKSEAFPERKESRFGDDFLRICEEKSAMEKKYVEALEFEEENYEATTAFLLQQDNQQPSIEEIFNGKIDDLVKCGDTHRTQIDPDAFKECIKTLNNFVVLNDSDILQPMRALQAFCLQKQPEDEEEEFAKELGQYHSPCPSCFEPFDLVQRLPMKSQCASCNSCIMCSGCWVGFRMKRCMCGGEFFPLLWKVDCEWVVSCARLQSVTR